MRFFMIEWFHAGACVYKQEYFREANEAFKRFAMLEHDVPEARPEITTLHFEDQ